MKTIKGVKRFEEAKDPILLLTKIDNDYSMERGAKIDSSNSSVFLKFDSEIQTIPTQSEMNMWNPFCDWKEKNLYYLSRDVEEFHLFKDSLQLKLKSDDCAFSHIKTFTKPPTPIKIKLLNGDVVTAGTTDGLKRSVTECPKIRSTKSIDVLQEIKETTGSADVFYACSYAKNVSNIGNKERDPEKDFLAIKFLECLLKNCQILQTENYHI